MYKCLSKATPRLVQRVLRRDTSPSTGPLLSQNLNQYAQNYLTSKMILCQASSKIKNFNYYFQLILIWRNFYEFCAFFNNMLFVHLAISHCLDMRLLLFQSTFIIWNLIFASTTASFVFQKRALSSNTNPIKQSWVISSKRSDRTIIITFALARFRWKMKTRINIAISTPRDFWSHPVNYYFPVIITNLDTLQRWSRRQKSLRERGLNPEIIFREVNAN